MDTHTHTHTTHCVHSIPHASYVHHIPTHTTTHDTPHPHHSSHSHHTHITLTTHQPIMPLVIPAPVFNYFRSTYHSSTERWPERHCETAAGLVDEALATHFNQCVAKQAKIFALENIKDNGWQLYVSHFIHAQMTTTQQLVTVCTCKVTHEANTRSCHIGTEKGSCKPWSLHLHTEEEALSQTPPPPHPRRIRMHCTMAEGPSLYACTYVCTYIP